MNDYLDVLADYLYREHICEIPPGQKILINEIGLDLSQALVRRCNQLKRDGDSLDCNVVLLAHENNDLAFEVSPTRAVEYRNQFTPLVIFIPTQLAGLTASLQGFTTYPIGQIMKDLLGEYRKMNSELGIPDFSKSFLDDLYRLTKLDSVLRFSIQTNSAADPMAYFAKNLPNIGLISDTIDSARIFLNLERNLSYSLKLSRTFNPLVLVENLLENCGLSAGATRDTIQQAITEELQTKTPWVMKLSSLDNDDLLFSNWPFSSVNEMEMQSLAIKTFLNANGTINARSKLSIHPTSNEFLSSGIVVIDWICEPKKLANDIAWQIDVLNSVNLDFAEVVTSSKVKSGLRSKKFDLSDHLEDGQQHYIIRISAVDNFGNILIKRDGTPATAYSEDFLLVPDMGGEGGISDPKAVNIASIAEAFVKTVLEDRFYALLEVPRNCREHTQSQTFEFPLGNRIARMRISRYVRTLERAVISNLENALTFREEMRLGAISLDANAVVTDEVVIPKNLLEARRKYLKCFVQGESIQFPETAFWPDEMRTSLNEYAQVYELALKESSPEGKQALLSLDLVDLRIHTAVGFINATIILPTHPLRSLWIAQHYEYLSSIAGSLLNEEFGKRRNLIDLSLLTKLRPENLPFVIQNGADTHVYSGELVFGVGIYLPLDTQDVASSIAVISNALGIGREFRVTEDSSKKVAEHLQRYHAGNSFTPGIKIAVFNPGDGRLAADAVSTFVKSRDVETENVSRIEVSCFAESYSFSDPVGALVDLQKNLVERHPHSSNLFLPFFSVKALSLKESADGSINDFDRYPESLNVSILQSATKLKQSEKSIELDHIEERSSLLDGLITYLYSFTVQIDNSIIFCTSVSTGKQSSLKMGLESLHRTYLASISSSDTPYNLSLSLDPKMTNMIGNIHKRTDWVLTVDRFIGLNLYEELLSFHNSEIVVLDYSPDFVDGFGDRLTLTTTKHIEVSRIIQKAMRELGLANEGKSSVDVLRRLAKISGRLAMRLLNENSFATEAVGLCATVDYLEDNGELESTIIIPVDAHQELFGLNRHDPNLNSQRCDLLLVRLSKEGYTVELLEVKARKGHFIADLPRVMQNQLDNTEALLNKLLFSEVVSRVDRDLQWARWASLLHFYADRSKLYGNFSETDFMGVHELIQDLCDMRVAPRMKKSGYIVSLLASDGDVDTRSQAYKMTVLNDEKLIRSGYTTIKEHELKVQKHSVILGINAPESPLTEDLPAGELNDGFQPVTEPESMETEVGSGESIAEKNEAPREAKAEVKKMVGEIVTVVLGASKNSDNVTWDISLKGSPHGVIVGIPGQGKSVTTRNILNQFAAQGLSSIVFDFHGDMGSKIKYSTNIINVAKEGLPFSPFDFDAGAALPIRSAAQEIAEILTSIGNLGEIQTTNVNLAIRDCYQNLGWDDYGVEGTSLPSISNFVSSLTAIEAQNRGKNAVARLQSFTDYDLFREVNSTSFKILDSKGFVFDVSKYRQDEVKITAGAFILRKIYNEMFQWKNASAPRLAIVLDEAHRLAKDPTIPKIMKEGRKFGIVVLLVSQSLEDFAPQVIDNAGSKIAFRTNFPASRKVASFLQSKNSVGLADTIEGLRNGFAMVSTPQMNYPEMLKMNLD